MHTLLPLLRRPPRLLLAASGMADADYQIVHDGKPRAAWCKKALPRRDNVRVTSSQHPRRGPRAVRSATPSPVHSQWHACIRFVQLHRLDALLCVLCVPPRLAWCGRYQRVTEAVLQARHWAIVACCVQFGEPRGRCACLAPRAVRLVCYVVCCASPVMAMCSSCGGWSRPSGHLSPDYDLCHITVFGIVSLSVSFDEEVPAGMSGHAAWSMVSVCDSLEEYRLYG